MSDILICAFGVSVLWVVWAFDKALDEIQRQIDVLRRDLEKLKEGK